MLNLFRRHLKSCPHTSRDYRRCKCPIHVEGSLASQKIRKGLDLINWESAQALIREWEAEGRIGGSSHTDPVTVREAIADFFLDAKARHLAEATIEKLRVLLDKHLIQYCEYRGIRYINELTVDEVRKFRASWKDGAISSQKKLERLRSFFRFCVITKWIIENPALALRSPKTTQPPTLPFSKEEMKKILEACDRLMENKKIGLENAKRLKAVVLLFRYTGLRIGDIVTFSKDRLHGNKVFLYTQKTGVPVYVPIPAYVLDCLNQIEPRSSGFYFWSGNGKVSTKRKNLDRSLRYIFDHKAANIHKGHAHRFRDTFAVELLEKGVPLEQVSILLGHRSIKITEKHYAPWVKSRQEQLEQSVMKSWE